MSKDWTPEELARASEAMKAAGQMSYEEVCAEIKRQMADQTEEEKQ